MRVLGVDPGYERVGIAVVERDTRGKEVVLFSDCIVTQKNTNHSERISMIANSVDDVLEKYLPDVMAIETLFFNENKKTAMKVSEARGAMLSCASRKKILIEEFSPLQVKMATTGYGRADKKQVIGMVKKLTGIKKLPKYDDEFDAIAVAITCIAHSNSPK